MFSEFPFLKSIQNQIENLGSHVKPFEFPSMDFDFTGNPGIYDFIITVDPEDASQVVWIIKDYSSRYRQLQELQLQRNLALMEKERLEAKAHKLDMLKDQEANARFDAYKDDFLSRINHDIRMSLRDIKTLLGTLYSACDDEYLKGHLRAIEKIAGHVIDATDSILIEYYPEDSRSIKFIVEDFNLLELLAERESAVNSLAKDKPVTFSLNVQPDLPEELNGDAFNLKKVLHILLDHSLKHTTEGAVSLDVRVLSKDEENYTIRFQVKGQGGSDEVVEAESKALAIAAKLVEIQGGNLRQKTVRDNGLSFDFAIRYPVPVA